MFNITWILLFIALRNYSMYIKRSEDGNGMNKKIKAFDERHISGYGSGYLIDERQGVLLI